MRPSDVLNDKVISWERKDLILHERCKSSDSIQIWDENENDEKWSIGIKNSAEWIHRFKEVHM